jgi:hypothetical protein
MIDFTGVVKIMGNHDSKYTARRQFIAPIGEPFHGQF